MYNRQRESTLLNRPFLSFAALFFLEKRTIIARKENICNTFVCVFFPSKSSYSAVFRVYFSYFVILKRLEVSSLKIPPPPSATSRTAVFCNFRTFATEKFIFREKNGCTPNYFSKNRGYPQFFEKNLYGNTHFFPEK